MTLLYGLPWWLAIFLVVGFFVAAACGGHILVHRSFAKTDFLEHNDVAGFIIAVVGVIYAVLLAFLTIVVWEQYAEAENRSVAEVDGTTDLWRLANRLDEPDRSRLGADVIAYVRAVAFDEWPKLRYGGTSAEAQRAIFRLYDDATGMHVATLRQSNLQNQVLDRVQSVADLRRRRVNSNHSGVPAVLWLALLAGAATVIGFEYIFGMRNFRVQLLMTAATAIIIGLSFAVVIELDYPYRGDIAISPERWIALYDDVAPAR